jgi:hypothetical protein
VTSLVPENAPKRKFHDESASSLNASRPEA